MKKIICIILTLILSVSLFASCKKTTGENSDKTVETAANGEALIDGYWKGDFEGEKAVFDFEHDGTGKMYFTSGGYDFYCDIEWSADGEIFTLIANGASTEYEYAFDIETLKFADTVFERATIDDIPENAIDVEDITKDKK